MYTYLRKVYILQYNTPFLVVKACCIRSSTHTTMNLLAQYVMLFNLGSIPVVFRNVHDYNGTGATPYM